MVYSDTRLVFFFLQLLEYYFNFPTTPSKTEFPYQLFLFSCAMENSHRKNIAVLRSTYTPRLAQ